MTKEILVNYIKEKIKDITEAMSETQNQNGVHFCFLKGELEAYQDVLKALDEPGEGSSDA